MNKNIVLIAAAAFLFAGCDKIKLLDTDAARKKRTAAQEEAEKAQARFAAKLAAGAVHEEAGPGNAATALAGLLCSSPGLMDDIEGDIDLISALSGEGGDPGEVKRQVSQFRRRYRRVIEKELPARGATFEEFSGYAAGWSNAEQKKKFAAIVAEKCPRGDKARIENTAAGLLSRFAAPAPR